MSCQPVCSLRLFVCLRVWCGCHFGCVWVLVVWCVWVLVDAAHRVRVCDASGSLVVGFVCLMRVWLCAVCSGCAVCACAHVLVCVLVLVRVWVLVSWSLWRAWCVSMGVAACVHV